MTVLTIQALAFAGFAALAASMKKYRGISAAGEPSHGRLLSLRIAGWVLLAAGLAQAAAQQGFSVGIVLWFGTAMVAALSVAFLLTCRKLWLGR